MLTLIVVSLEFVSFKLLYPYPDFFDDSYSYLFAACVHLDISIWPIGYSKFLGAFHRITYSDIALVSFQYFFMQLANLYFYFTVAYFFKMSKANKCILWVFLFVNPLLLCLCNLVNSDALFAALTMIWLTQLIWVVLRPSIYYLTIQALLLFLCFTIRNNAYYYPLISAIAILLSRQSWIRKGLGIALPLLLIALFVFHTRDASYKLTGTRQFSLFSGWQLANNALYIYDQVQIDSTTLPTPEARELNRISIEFFRHVNPQEYRSYLESYVGNFFIKDRQAPLKIYYHLHAMGEGEIGDIVDWGRTSAALEPFGKSVILHHPIAYIRFFVWPNFFHYLLPPLSNLEKYNYGFHHVAPIAKYWFHFPSTKIHYFSANLQGILLIYTAYFLCCNLYLLWKLTSCTYQWLSSLSRKKPPAVIIMILSFVLLNFLFSLVSTVDILRYQCAPMIVITTLVILLDEYQSTFVKTQKSDRERVQTSVHSRKAIPS